MSHGGSVFQVEDAPPAGRLAADLRAPSSPPPTVRPPSQLVDAGHAAPASASSATSTPASPQDPDIRMVPGSMMVEGRRLRFAVSDNEDAHGPDGPG